MEHVKSKKKLSRDIEDEILGSTFSGDFSDLLNHKELQIIFNKPTIRTLIYSARIAYISTAPSLSFAVVLCQHLPSRSSFESAERLLL